MKLVMLHGRSQEDKDPEKLRHTWVTSLHQGALKAGLELPLQRHDIVFPYFGDALRDVSNAEADSLALITIAEPHLNEDEFKCQILGECLDNVGVTEEVIAEEASPEVQASGPLSVPWIQRGLELLDRFAPQVSAATLRYVAEDVALYLQDEQVRNYIEHGVAKAFEACGDDPNIVVVGHSFGSIVAYNMLRKRNVVKTPVRALVTIGSPLAVKAIHRALRPIAYPPDVDSWFNAYDEDDAVALFPLDRSHFGDAQPIKNYGGVDNDTLNQHGIRGYLSDRVVATHIIQELTAGMEP